MQEVLAAQNSQHNAEDKLIKEKMYVSIAANRDIEDKPV